MPYNSLFRLHILSVALLTVLWVGSAGAEAPPGRFVDNGDTVKDQVTGLIWQKTSLQMKQGDAEEYCQNLSYAGHSDWRVPSYPELFSLVDPREKGPSIDSNYFPGTATANYYTHTTNPGGTEQYRVHFNSGSTARFNNSNPDVQVYVRCVRVDAGSSSEP